MPYIAKARLEELLCAGGQMSNACFNLKQLDPDPDRKQSFERMQQRWDNARAALRSQKDGARNA